MEEQEGIVLMKSSKSAREWNLNRRKIKDAYGGVFPVWWYFIALQSDFLDKIRAQWSHGEPTSIE